MSYQTKILKEIAARLTASNSFAYVGYAPEDTLIAGANMPAALVSDDYEEISGNPGGKTQSRWQFSVWLYTGNYRNRLEQLNELQHAVIAALTPPWSPDLPSMWLGPETQVDKGEPAEESVTPPWFTPGYYQGRSVRRLIFTCNYQTIKE